MRPKLGACLAEAPAHRYHMRMARTILKRLRISLFGNPIVRTKLLQTSIRGNASHHMLPLRRELTKQAVILMVMSLALTACSTTLPATMKIEGNQILRGSATGKVGRDAVLSLENLEGLSCSGEMFVRVTESTTEGTIQCSDARKGKFIANGKGDSWTGEGKLNDGSKFFVLVGTTIWPEH